jgi:hypothetical protein
MVTRPHLVVKGMEQINPMYPLDEEQETEHLKEKPKADMVFNQEKEEFVAEKILTLFVDDVVLVKKMILIYEVRSNRLH